MLMRKREIIVKFVAPEDYNKVLILRIFYKYYFKKGKRVHDVKEMIAIDALAL